MTLRLAIAKGLKRMMERTGTTEKQLAEVSGISLRQIKRLLDAECVPTSQGVLTGLTCYFNCEETDIIAFGLGLCGA